MNWLADNFSWIPIVVIVGLLVLVVVNAVGQNPYAAGTKESVVWHFIELQNEEHK